MTPFQIDILCSFVVKLRIRDYHYFSSINVFLNLFSLVFEFLV